MNEWIMILRLTLSFALGGLIGYERERKSHSAGLRTHMLVAMGSAMFSIASAYGFGAMALADPSRVAAQIVSGIGFLGAGTIFLSQDKVRGLTTAASIWVVAAIGMLAGVGLYILAIYGTALGWVVLFFFQFPERQIRKRRVSKEIRPRHHSVPPDGERDKAAGSSDHNLYQIALEQGYYVINGASCPLTLKKRRFTL